MELSVEHLGAVQFEIKARRHTILCDQPVEDGGFDEGMTPQDLLLASLASCAGYYAAQYLRKQGLAKEGTRVRLAAEKAENPPRLDNFRIEVNEPQTGTEDDDRNPDLVNARNLFDIATGTGLYSTRDRSAGRTSFCRAPGRVRSVMSSEGDYFWSRKFPTTMASIPEE
jgi:putative redox protein